MAGAELERHSSGNPSRTPNQTKRLLGLDASVQHAWQSNADPVNAKKDHVMSFQQGEQEVLESSSLSEGALGSPERISVDPILYLKEACVRTVGSPAGPIRVYFGLIGEPTLFLAWPPLGHRKGNLHRLSVAGWVSCSWYLNLAASSIWQRAWGMDLVLTEV